MSKIKTIKASKRSEIILGTADDNIIKAGGGNDIIYAVMGSNKIFTQSNSNDTVKVYSGSGNDTIMAGRGNETYFFSNGHGDDTIIANQKGTVILDISDLSNISFDVKNNDVILFNKFDTFTEKITIKNYLKGNLLSSVFVDDNTSVINLREYLSQINSFVIGNSSTEKNQKINGSVLNETLLGGAGNDTLNGKSGVDVFNGGKGNDKLIGYIKKEGKEYNYNDISNSKNFVFDYKLDNNTGYGIGDGKDTIVNSKSADKITFNIKNSSIEDFVNNIKYYKTGNNLVIKYQSHLEGNVAKEDSVTIQNYFKVDNSKRCSNICVTDGINSEYINLNDVYMNYGDKKITSTGFDDRIEGNEYSNNYLVSDLKSKTVINDLGGEDSLKISHVNANDIVVSYFDMDKDGNALEGMDSLRLISWDVFNENKNLDSGIEIEHFLDISDGEINAGGVGEIENIDKGESTLYFRVISPIIRIFDANYEQRYIEPVYPIDPIRPVNPIGVIRYFNPNEYMINHIKQSVINWFSDNTGFSDTQDVMKNGTSEDINSLMNAYAFGYYKPIEPIYWICEE